MVNVLKYVTKHPFFLALHCLEKFRFEAEKYFFCVLINIYSTAIYIAQPNAVISRAKNLKQE